MHTVNIRVTHHRAEVAILEVFAFPDVKKALKDIHALRSVKECVIIQTCNRVEIFAAAEDVNLAYHDIVDYLMEDVISRMRSRKAFEHGDAECVPPDLLTKHIVEFSAKLHDAMEVEYHTDALRHLLRLAAGIESMIVGEDQILGQVRHAYNLARALGTVGPFFEKVFTKALHVGQLVRAKTNINKGAVSIGSAAVELAEEVLGSLEGRVALLIGAGEMGKLVAKSLAEHRLESILVANRTYSRAENLAAELGGRAVPFEALREAIAESDLIITATSSPEAIITRELIEGARKKQLVIIDVAIPRDVSEDVASVEGVRLFNIDSLRRLAERNRRAREKEIVKVEKIIDREMGLLIRQLYRIDVEGIVRDLFREAERVRQRELGRAMRMLGNGIGERERRIIDDLTRVIVNRLTSPIAENIRRAAEQGDQEAVRVAEKWFRGA
ncbi:MAG: glutamyl-tRNA reductase [Euryarchaeota archaeon]|nr:glutamyl-tRNA reductase [Euryarchaeota archaeon]